MPTSETLAKAGSLVWRNEMTSFFSTLHICSKDYRHAQELPSEATFHQWLSKSYCITSKLKPFLNLRIFVIWPYLPSHCSPSSIHIVLIAAFAQVLLLSRHTFSSLLNSTYLVQCLLPSCVLLLTLWLRIKSPTLPVIAGKWLNPLHLSLLT